MKNALIVLTSIFISFSVYSEPEKISRYASETELSELADSKQWRKLLHFGGSKSHIHNSDFFLSSDGRENPLSELKATLESITSPEREYPENLHPQCRYPSRVQWLSEQLGSRLILPKVSCPTFENWKAINQAESVSVVFVSGFFGNPASFFGHLMLKLNQPKQAEKDDSPLLDLSVNYGADVPDGDGPIKYMSYGLFGGYDASYTQDDYYIYDASYAEVEQRVLWEYKLNLTPREVSLLQNHLWEIGQAKFTYYFLSFNCASQLANFINIVVDSPLLNQNQLWDMPIDVFKNIAKTQHHGKKLLGEVKKRDSKYDRLHAKYMDLSADEKLAAKGIAKDIGELKGDSYQALSSHSRSRVLSVLYDFIEVKISTESESEIEELKENKRQLMLANLTFEPADISWQKRAGLPPHQAQNPKLLGLSAFTNKTLGTGLELRSRVGYYDFLATEASRFRDSNATFLDFRLRSANQKVWLHSFDFFHIAALNILDVDLFSDNRWAWSAKLSVEQESLATTDDLRFRFDGGFGSATRVWKDVSLYAIPKLNLDFSHWDDSNLGAELGVLYTASSFWKMHAFVTPYVTAQNAQDMKFNWENRFGNQSDWDVRLTFQYDKESEATISSNWYF
ncbi:conserved hypothetical protein [Vibrio nigripulchritudo MADA3029]|uniref:Lnb N-terminal periplasmic domain-containing protein n=1 Tax=Vibrio nigripulchritudo TaxID=28173 RepID=UPI0003B1AC0D|nr:DUF4105 domain-containing protein [Vibrio nigripulchritudo]CCN45461.1 conserved hypothetical protein [Vibrio nigripulchritudo MADA3020]CCN56375.1 conserved hypothetical protein [Vibrio nigripulchritudo MADA3021]CCN57935.1 conserved hypothetical protein [Vibrio nigripulchritudo MADA3029]